MTDLNRVCHFHLRRLNMFLHPVFDGNTHINISLLTAQTRLGYLLSNLSPLGFTLNGISYASVEAYWYELNISRHCPEHLINNLRRMSGTHCKSVGRKLRDKYGLCLVLHFEEHIKEALLAKVLQNRELKRLLRLSTLPITHYLWSGTKGCPVVKDFPKHYWMCVEFERIRGLLQSGEL